MKPDIRIYLHHHCNTCITLEALDSASSSCHSMLCVVLTRITIDDIAFHFVESMESTEYI